MENYIKCRVVNVGKYVVASKATVRQTAEIFSSSRSTIFNDCTKRLPVLDPGLAKEVRKVLDFNKSQRSIRGGQALKEKYLLACT